MYFFEKGDPMAINPNVHLRLRRSTHDKLRAVLELSAHRSMSSLADEILEEGLNQRLDNGSRRWWKIQRRVFCRSGEAQWLTAAQKAAI